MSALTDRIAALNAKRKINMNAHIAEMKAKRNDPAYVRRSREFKCAQLNVINGYERYGMYQGYIIDSKTNEQIKTQ